MEITVTVVRLALEIVAVIVVTDAVITAYQEVGDTYEDERKVIVRCVTSSCSENCCKGE